MKIYKNRYQARKAARALGILGVVLIVKVDAGDGEHGYTLMDEAAYKIWRKQK